MSANIDAVLARLDEMNNGEINYEVYRELHDLVSAIEDDVQAPIELFPGTLEALDALSIRARTTSPDAATEGDYHEGLEEGIKIGRAECDAALAAIERVRSIDTGNNRALYGNDFEAGMAKALWLVKTALDGAPEPECEAQLERVAARLREVVYLCGDDLGCQCEEAQDASADLARELGIIAAERPTLTADEVWAIARAEHDYANDSDNVGAFVGSLTDALRTAGVAFDEQPFIDSGYLLPVEGEKP